MRVPALAIVIALSPFSAAADEAFRTRLTDYLADYGGCPGSRALVERELVGFERGRAEGEPASLALFGKLAAEWTAEDIRDLLAVIRDCEGLRARPGEDGARRLAERLDFLAQAMRRAVVLSAQPPEMSEAASSPGLRADALPEAGRMQGGARTGRRGQGPAFVPVDASRAAPTLAAAADGTRRPPSHEMERPAAEASAPGTAPTLGPADTVAAPQREALRVALAPGSATPDGGPSFRRAAGVAQVQPEPCAVTRERFERIHAGMSPVEVETVFGCRGRLDSAAAIDGVGTFEVYVWSPPSLAGSVTVTFQDRRLKAKVQRGLI